MIIELEIDGKNKKFTTPFVPMIAKRKIFEIEARQEERDNQDKMLSSKEVLEEDDEYYSVLPDVVFNGQFTLDQMYEGASHKYIHNKVLEAVTGVKPDSLSDDEKGKEQGK